MLIYGILITSAAAGWWSKSLVVAVIFTLLLLAINLPLYRFFLVKRGLWFMIKAIPWHWVYYFYSGLAFAIGTGRFFFFRHRSQKPRL